MTLSAVEQTQFRAYIANRLLREIEILIPEYIHTNQYLIEDIEDKGYETVEEAYAQDASNISFHWS
jgi:hypothetical protein